MLEKISSIQAAVETPQPTDSPASESATGGAPRQPAANPFNEEGGYGRSLQLLREMQSQIEERVRPMAEQAVELEVAQIRERSTRDQATLGHCLAQIDQCLLRCAERLDEYNKTQISLMSINQRLAALGEPPERIPESLLNQDLTDILQSRVEDLHRKGKL